MSIRERASAPGAVDAGAAQPAASIERMLLDDIARVLEIDRQSFPLPWSAGAYRYELVQNKDSYFFVAVEKPGIVAPAPRKSWLAGVLGWLAQPPSPAGGRHVVGYAGFWYIVDEAHVSTIAVTPEWRGRGVGEQLLVAMLERALDLGATAATLEVRVTNEPAQRLYRKYNFEVVGRRKRYYRDNGEDALLMTAALHPDYRQHMRHLLAGRENGDRT